ncbi:MAG: hypothetical protein GXO90_07510 [FCB group bacterium]|nr:hypothetical protein [FCB group bacterium]
MIETDSSTRDIHRDGFLHIGIKLARRPLEIVFLRYVVALFVLGPVFMWVSWLAKDCQPLSVVIIDKSSLDNRGTEHSSLAWVLNYEKYLTPKHRFYQAGKDYYGFHGSTDQSFYTNDLSELDSAAFEALLNQSQVAYFSDVYGVYERDWYHVDQRPAKLIYGGLNDRDEQLIKSMIRRGKTVIAEFSFLSPPTTGKKRKAIEQVFRLSWTGWTGRFFESLDTLNNEELPYWVTSLYMQHYGGNWPFRKAGIVLVNTREDIVILENETHLVSPVPIILTTDQYQTEFGLPAWINYPFWFDITFGNDADSITTVSMYHLPVNAQGDSLLQQYNIPQNFPAVLMEKRPVPRTVYFCGDFSDNPIPNYTAYFRGIHWFQTFFHNPRVLSDRRGFFWRFYRPFMIRLLEKIGSNRRS